MPFVVKTVGCTGAVCHFPAFSVGYGDESGSTVFECQVLTSVERYAQMRSVAFAVSHVRYAGDLLRLFGLCVVLTEICQSEVVEYYPRFACPVVHGNA